MAKLQSKKEHILKYLFPKLAPISIDLFMQEG